MFVVTFVIMLPIALIRRSRQGLGSRPDVGVCSELCPNDWRLHRADHSADHSPCRALGTLAGVSITFISMAPAVQMFMTPMIGFICFAIILLSWFGGVKYRGIPAGLVAIAVGTFIAWGSTVVGLNYGGMSLQGLTDAVANFGFECRCPRSAMFFPALNSSG